MLAMPATVKPEDEKPTLAIGEVLLDEVDGTEFQAHEIIGRGGMGEVYRATRLSDGAACAVKCVRRSLVHTPNILLRTRFESQAFRQISHPNVVRVLGTGVRSDNVPWMAMEYLRGFTLDQIIDRMGRIPLRWAIAIVRDLCRGLHAIHARAIHRDVKPSNVHLGLDAVTRVLDLGAAKSNDANVHLTSTGFQVGTMTFMAPEQLENTMDIDHRADVWAATVVLYLLMTGVHPFAFGGTLPANKIKLGFSILTDPHVPLLSVLPKAPSFFGQIIDRGLAKDPDSRHRSAEELAQVLTAALEYLETVTGHAEPLSSLVGQVSGVTEPVVAEPPRLLWTPPRTTEPMPSPAAKSPELAAPVRIVWSAPRTTEPMPPPAPRALPQEAPAPAPLPAANPTAELLTPESTERRTVVPQSSTPPEAPEDAAADHRRSDVRVKLTPATPQASPVEEDAAVLEEAPLLAARHEDPEEGPPLEARRARKSSARQWLAARSLLGAPRWLVVMACMNATLSAAGALHFFGPPRSAEHPSGPIVVPVRSVPVPVEEPAPAPTTTASTTPAPAPTTTGTATSRATAPVATAAPVPPGRAAGAPRPRRPASAPSSGPAPAQTSRAIFGVEN